MASDFLCDGVKFRWREGLIRSAQRSSADNSFGVCSEPRYGIGGTLLMDIIVRTSEAVVLELVGNPDQYHS